MVMLFRLLRNIVRQAQLSRTLTVYNENIKSATYIKLIEAAKTNRKNIPIEYPLAGSDETCENSARGYARRETIAYSRRSVNSPMWAVIASINVAPHRCDNYTDERETRCAVLRKHR